jgi:hypothetical protein
VKDGNFWVEIDHQEQALLSLMLFYFCIRELEGMGYDQQSELYCNFTNDEHLFWSTLTLL